MKILNLAVSLFVFSQTAMSVSANEQTIGSVGAAFDHLQGRKSVLPYPSDTDAAAIELLRNNAERGKSIFTSRFLDGRITLPQARQILTLVGVTSIGVEWARDVASHYELGDPATPFQGVLAMHGSADDAKRLEAIIRKNPDASASTQLAELMVVSGTPSARNTIEKIGSLPGRWKEGFEVRKVLGDAKRGRKGSCGGN